MDDIQCSSFGVDGVAHLQEVLEMGIDILICLSVEWTSLDHIHQTSLQLKTVIAGLVLVQSSRDVATGRGRELTKRLLGHG